MKKIAIILLPALFITLSTSPLWAKRYPVSEEENIKGGFEMSGYINTAVGWQRFSNDPITEVAQDGSYAGPLGEWLPASTSGAPAPVPGSDYFEFFIPKFELDMVKHLGKRARLRGDIQFGRANSGSALPVPGINVVHAYGAVTIYEPKEVEIWLGRLGLQAGFEPYEDYLNDTVSYSILWRGLVPPPNATGVQITGKFSENVRYYFALANGVVNDTIFNMKEIPSMVGTIMVTWGPDDKQSAVVVTPFAGPESRSNRHWTYGLDAYTYWWVVPDFQLGMELCVQNDQGNGGPNTNYYAGLLNLHWDLNESWYAVGKYAYTSQTTPGNGVLNLTGAEQRIHEITLGFGHYLTDTTKLKAEARLDIVDPAAAASQYVGGFAMSMNQAF